MKYLQWINRLIKRGEVLMKFVGNIFALAFIALLGFLSIDFNAKDPVPVKPKTPTYSQFMTCDIGENWSNVNVMMDDWNNMDVDGMSFALGHSIYEGSAEGIIVIKSHGNYFGTQSKRLINFGTQDQLMNSKHGLINIGQ